MIFTDNDLAKLVDRILWKKKEKVYQLNINLEEMEGLMDRLAAAEEFGRHAIDMFPDLQNCIIAKAWGKSRGNL